MRHEVSNFTFGSTSPETVNASGAAISNPLLCDRYREKTVQVIDAGALAGLNADLEGSLDGNNWGKLITGIAGPGIFTVTAAVKFIRLNVLAVGAGNAAAMLGGFDSRSDGG